MSNKSQVEVKKHQNKYAEVKGLGVIACLFYLFPAIVSELDSGSYLQNCNVSTNSRYGITDRGSVIFIIG